MVSKKIANGIFLVMTLTLLLLSLITVRLFIKSTGLGGGPVYYVPYHLRNPKIFEFKDYSTEKLSKIIEDYKNYKGEPKKYHSYIDLGAAVRIIAMKEDFRALEILSDIMKNFKSEYKEDVIAFASRSRNKAAIPVLCDALKNQISIPAEGYIAKWHMAESIVNAIINIDDPSALECLVRVSYKLPHGKDPVTSDAIGDKADRAIKRWQDIRSGKIKQTAPFDVDCIPYTTSRKLLKVSSFGGYKFTIDDKLGRGMQQRLNDTTDQFEFGRYYSGFLGLFAGYIELKLTVTELSTDKAAALEKLIAKQTSDLKTLPTINGNPYMVSVSEAEGGHYFAYAVMKVGDLEVSAEMKSESHYWFMCNANEIIAIFKSFTRGLDPNKKFSIFY